MTSRMKRAVTVLGLTGALAVIGGDRRAWPGTGLVARREQLEAQRLDLRRAPVRGAEVVQVLQPGCRPAVPAATRSGRLRYTLPDVRY